MFIPQWPFRLCRLPRRPCRPHRVPPAVGACMFRSGNPGAQGMAQRRCEITACTGSAGGLATAGQLRACGGMHPPGALFPGCNDLR